MFFDWDVRWFVGIRKQVKVTSYYSHAPEHETFKNRASFVIPAKMAHYCQSVCVFAVKFSKKNPPDTAKHQGDSVFSD